MRGVLFVIALVLISSAPAIAAFDPSPQEVCSPSGPATSRLDPRKLVKYLLREVGAREYALAKPHVVAGHEYDAQPPGGRAVIVHDIGY